MIAKGALVRRHSDHACHQKNPENQEIQSERALKEWSSLHLGVLRKLLDVLHDCPEEIEQRCWGHAP